MVVVHKPISPLTLVMHDWGSVYGLDWCVLHKDRVKSLICLEVLTREPLRAARATSRASLAWLLVYQWWLLAVFISGRIVPLIGNILLFLLVWLGLGPDLAPPPRAVICPPRGPRWHTAYPYLHYWLDIIFRGSDVRSLEKIKVPLLFVYGQRKRLHFHLDRDVERFARRRGQPRDRL